MAKLFTNFTLFVVAVLLLIPCQILRLLSFVMLFLSVALEDLYQLTRFWVTGEPLPLQDEEEED